MAEPADTAGGPALASIEWRESSGPVAPRFQYGIHLVVQAGPEGIQATCERRDASGTTVRAGSPAPGAFVALCRELLAVLPLGTRLDLVGELRTRKGISFNQVVLARGADSYRLDYVLSQLDEADGDPRARTVVAAIRSWIQDALGPGPA